MEESILLELSKMVYDYCGLRYSDRLSVLKDRISKRVKELGLSFWEYCGYLRTTPAEWDLLVELLTINETYFYREENQLNECCLNVLPQIKNKPRNRPIRIWSAACSTGEEPYTLAMLIQETGQFLPGSVEIIATDIDKKVLKKAEKGWYHQGSFAFRRIPDNLMRKYFVENEGGYQVNSFTRNMVQFKHLNLLDSGKAGHIGQVDVIFCRNVLIYFDQQTTKKVIHNLHQNLVPGGYLFLGHAESITDMGMGFEKVDSEKTFYYRKELDLK
ncbi:CheR family methyltransferase [Neobacillus muris]|uniref:CheR family methyltransferase n=1 Tax=Neobacillus muris TaxID=2941334 RepID=UPI00203AE65F|nr:protein-glutamate O-methyltransferase CheR [Neobacillus muris]